MTCEEQKTFLIRKGKKIFRDNVEKALPEHGPAQRVFVAFDYPGTEYEAFLTAEADCLDWNGRRVSVMMRPQGSKRVMSSYIWKGTKQELLRWLDREECQSELQERFQDLADSLTKEDWT